MGSRLEKAKEGLENNRETTDEAIEKAQDDANEMQEVRAALEGVPTDTDDDVFALKEVVESSAVTEATSDMEGDVKGMLDSSRSAGEGIKSEASDAENNSREAADAYGEAAESRFAGEASDAMSQANGNADAFAEVQDDVDEVIDEGEDEYDRFLQEIRG